MSSDPLTARLDLLLGIAELVSRHRDLRSLFGGLTGALRPLVPFDFASVHVYNEATGTVTFYELGGEDGPRPPRESTLERSAVEWILETQRPLVIRDAGGQGHPPVIARLLHEQHVRAALLLPLTTALRRVGAIGIGARAPGAYDDVDLEFLRRVASQVAVAVDNALHAEQAAQQQAELAHERDRWRALLEITNALVGTLRLEELLAVIAPCLHTVVVFDFASIALYDPERRTLQTAASFATGGAPPPEAPDALPLAGTPLERAFATGEALLVEDIARQAPAGPADHQPLALARRYGVQSGCAIPLVGRRRTVGAFFLAAREPGRFAAADLDLLAQVGRQVAVAVENALAYQEIEQLTRRLRVETDYLKGELRESGRFEAIVGGSPALRRALGQLEDVAPTDTTVLLLGETGTGKELFARALHDLSPRRQRTLVRVNCAAIPSGLLESELFGHEKGAFTGALDRKIGRFELADGGTIFLDEIGDIPLELQTKLLRVLQEREFERLGSTRSVRVDVRVVAATNQDLPALVAERRFRSDLYYRLNVYPIAIPPLREREGDIPLLVRHFVHKHAQRLKKTIGRIPTEAIEALERWSWPGNVRELENVIERAVIRARDGVLLVPALGEVEPAPSPPPPPSAVATLEAIEREHILRTLASTRWVVGGPQGAAARLGMKRSTLVSRMRKLGLTRPTP